MAEKEYIEREDVLNFLEETRDGLKGTPPFVELLNQCIDSLRVDFDFPPADVVEVKHGEWNEEEYPFCNVCMNCGLVIDRTCIKCNSGKLNYCPNCGAKMDGEKDG